MKSVCIVGAGPAGLAGAKVLLSTGKFIVTVLEKADRIGGIWALDESSNDGYLGPNTPTNLSRFTVSFSDLDWNSIDLYDRIDGEGSKAKNNIPMFPKAWHVNRYLDTYRRKFIPEGTILFGHEVVQTQRQEDPEGNATWKVAFRNKGSQDSTKDFDYLVLASGFFSQPRAPLFDTPRVKTIHSSKYRTLNDLFASSQDAAGKKILLIGGGNSSGETAAALAQHLSDARYSPTAAESQRYEDCSIVHVSPRPIYTLPPFPPCNDESKAFVPLDLRLYDLSRRPAGPITGNAGRINPTVKGIIHGALQSLVGGDQSELGSAGLVIPTGDSRPAAYAAISESYPEFVRSGMIDVVPGRVSALVDGEDGHLIARVQCARGEISIEDIGAVIYATGYSPTSAVDFLPDDVKQDLHYDPNSNHLPIILSGWQTSIDNVPDLAVLGFYEGPFWPFVEMQARLTADRWLSNKPVPTRPYEEADKLLDLRKAMEGRALDVPQYWFGDYAGFMEEMAAHLHLTRNDGLFAEREGCVSPARYLSQDSDAAHSEAIMRDLHETWHACREEGRYVARAAFRALQGNWEIHRTIRSALPSFPSGTLDGTASFHPRSPTKDKSGQSFDLEYLYIESGTLVLSNGATMNARRRYVYRYSEAEDKLSVWFVKPDKDLEVDYLFHDLEFIKPAEAAKEGACMARADHLCVEDMYWTQYRFPFKGISLLEFENTHTVRGPSKDYVATTSFRRPVKHIK